ESGGGFWCFFGGGGRRYVTLCVMSILQREPPFAVQGAHPAGRHLRPDDDLAKTLVLAEETKDVRGLLAFGPRAGAGRGTCPAAAGTCQPGRGPTSGPCERFNFLRRKVL